MQERAKKIIVTRDELYNRIEHLNAQEMALRNERIALEDKDTKLRHEYIALNQTMKSAEFETRLKNAQEQKQVDVLVALLCEIRNHFNQSRYTVFVPGRKGSEWSIIENQNLHLGRTTVAWGINNTSGNAIYLPNGSIAKFNIFDVTMDTLKIQLGLNLRVLIKRST